jgi:ribonuclease E
VRAARRPRPAIHRSEQDNGEVPPPCAASRVADAAPSAISGFGEVIDLGEEAVSEIVEVPEADAPQPRRRERVGKAVTAVLAEVTGSTVATVAAMPEPVADAIEPEAAEAEPEPQPEPEPAGAGAEAQPAPDRGEEGPKRRGWWSRALS